MGKASAGPAGSPIRRRRRLLLGLALAGSVLAFARLELIWVFDAGNGRVPFSSYPLIEEDPEQPRLKELRRREKLDLVAAPGKTQLDKLVLLRHWAHVQWPAGVAPFRYPPWDALEILDLAHKGNRAFCAQYAIVYLQALRSLDLHARYANLPGHFTVEAWSDDLNQWVVMDPTLDLAYEKGGRLLAGSELSDAAGRGDAAGIAAVAFDGSRSALTGQDLGFWKGYEIMLRSDQLARPQPVTVDGVRRELKLEKDPRAYPNTSRQALTVVDSFLLWKGPWLAKARAGETGSSDPDDFKDYYNQTLLREAGRDAARGELKVKLSAGNSPGFSTFLAGLEGDQDLPTVDQLVWPLQPGFNHLHARLRTRTGWEGHPSRMTAFYKPNWLAWGRR